jgi:phospholipid/cholesterol/gamma-HCH transport system substrate-binding protein
VTPARVITPVALGAAAIVAVVVLLGSGEKPYKVHARFDNASQLVVGDLVQVAGVPVGEIESLKITGDGQADVGFSVDRPYAPLRVGTQAVVRLPS